MYQSGHVSWSVNSFLIATIPFETSDYTTLVAISGWRCTATRPTISVKREALEVINVAFAVLDVLHQFVDTGGGFEIDE